MGMLLLRQRRRRQRLLLPQLLLLRRPLFCVCVRWCEWRSGGGDGVGVAVERSIECGEQWCGCEVAQLCIIHCCPFSCIKGERSHRRSQQTSTTPTCCALCLVLVRCLLLLAQPLPHLAYRLCYCCYGHLGALGCLCTQLGQHLRTLLPAEQHVGGRPLHLLVCRHTEAGLVWSWCVVVGTWSRGREEGRHCATARPRQLSLKFQTCQTPLRFCLGTVGRMLLMD